MADTSILPPAWQVPQIFRTRLGAKVGRQRTMVSDGHLMLVLHAPPRPDDNTRIGRFFWRAPDGAWLSKELGSGIAALKKHLDEYEDAIAALERQEEDAHSIEAYFAVLDRLAPLHRAARNLHQVLQEARAAYPEYHDLIDVRDRAYAIERRADLLYSGTKNSLDFAVAKRAEEQARSSERMAAAAYRLNTLAAFFFPILTVTAILGVDLTVVGALVGFDPQANPMTAGFAILIFFGILVFGFIAGGVLTSIINQSPPPEEERRTQQALRKTP